MLANILTAAASWLAEHPLLTYSVPEEFQGNLPYCSINALLLSGWRITM